MIVMGRHSKKGPLVFDVILQLDYGLWLFEAEATELDFCDDLPTFDAWKKCG